MGPHPVIATVLAAISPASTLCTAFPNGSRMDAYSIGMAGSSFQIFDSGIATYSANAPSASTPMIFTFWQMCASPVRHCTHFPQATCISAETKSPSFTAVTFLPVATTCPQNSWPGISGGLMRFCAHWSQLYMCRSVPQTDATFTFTRTSSGPIWGTGICRTSAPGAASGFTTASIVSGIQFLNMAR